MFSQNFHYLQKMVRELWKLSFHQTILRYNQIVFTTIKIIYNGMNKSVRESSCCILFNNTYNLHVKVRDNFLSSVQFTCNSIAFVSHWDFWWPVYKELLHFIIHSSCNFAVTSNNLCIKELRWIQFEGRFYILVIRVQCLVKFISFIIFSSGVGIIRITIVKKRFLRCHYILFHLANISIRKNNRYRSSHLAAINLFS